MVSKFLLNIFMKGSLHFDDGKLFLWNNPSFILTSSAFAVLQKAISDLYGSEGNNLIYLLAKIHGKNSTQIMVKRFGFKPNEENFSYFVDGSTLVGMGTMKLKEYDLSSKNAILESYDSTIPKKYIDLFCKSDFPIDNYMRGILAGGAEPLIGKEMKCTERKCMAKGDLSCEYHINHSKNEETSELLDSIIEKNNILEMSKRFLNSRSLLQRYLSKQFFSLKSGSLYFKDYECVILPIYLFTVIIKLINSGESNERLILKKTAKQCVNDFNIPRLSHNKISKQDWNSLFEKINCLGFGEFKIKHFVDSGMYIENSNSPLPQDYIALFGSQKKKVDIFSEILLESLIETVTEKMVEVEETSCTANGSKSCIFRVKFL